MRLLARYSLYLLLAGCTAQASVKESEPTMAVMDLSMLGRTVTVPVNQLTTILDWRGEDRGAEEMAITVGVARPAISSTPSALSPYVPAALPGVLDLTIVPIAVIEYGIEGFNQSLVINAFPEQTIILPTSFVRVSVFNSNATNLPVQFFASVSRAVGKDDRGARWSLFLNMAPAAATNINLPPFARRLLISRAARVSGLMGLLRAQWLSDFVAFNPIQTFNFAALADAGVLEVPGNVTEIRITNTDADTQSVVLTWFLEP